MVVKNDTLFAHSPRESRFYYEDEFHFKKVILDNYEYMVRADAEVNYNYKQPLPYAAVIDENNRIFVYKRWGSSSNAWESRLHEKISLGVWWHIESDDEHHKDILKDSLVREVEEELNIKSDQIKDVYVHWYINDESSDVSKVHFGVFYIVRVLTSNVELLDGELDNGEFVSIETLETMVASDEYDLETWSEIAFPALKEYLW